MSEDKQVYWDDQKNQFYWIEWIETGNNDIPVKHYIEWPHTFHDAYRNTTP